VKQATEVLCILGFLQPDDKKHTTEQEEQGFKLLATLADTQELISVDCLYVMLCYIQRISPTNSNDVSKGKSR